MFEFLSFLIALGALIYARKAFNEAALLRARLDALAGVVFQPRPGPVQQVAPSSTASPSTSRRP